MTTGRLDRATSAVIGGSGFYELQGADDLREVRIETPYGAPSDAIVLATVGGHRVAFLPRHGAGHRLLPGEVPARANIWALASLGVERIISVSAVGSLKEHIAPLSMVVPDQLIDRTIGRPSTFFGAGIVAHIAFNQPYCPELSALLLAAAGRADIETHGGGTLVVIEGPAFSTYAESALYRSWGADVIGMTALPEARLAREAGICYATLACVTDYDTWHQEHDAVSARMILANLLKNVDAARGVVANVLRSAPAARGCPCASALSDAIVTPLHLAPEERKRDLAPILARYAAVAP
jgi:5'-methylthioadenosine phosphorylase